MYVILTCLMWLLIPSPLTSVVKLWQAESSWGMRLSDDKTRALESTYPARCSNVYVWAASSGGSLMCMCMKHIVNCGCGWCAWSTQKAIFVWQSWPVSLIWSKVKPVFNSLVVLIIHSDAYISRSGNFRASDNDNRRTNQLLYPLCTCAQGNNVGTSL